MEWSDRELKELDTKTRKILAMQGVFHSKSSVDRLYLKRRDGRRGLISVSDCVREEERNLWECVRGSKK